MGAIFDDYDSDDEDEEEEEEQEVTKDMAIAAYNRLYGELEMIKIVFPKDYKFCFNSRRNLDEITYSYLAEKYQKLLHHS